jgi:hypothetical protein
MAFPSEAAGQCARGGAGNSRRSLPHCAVIRPSGDGQIDAMGAANALIANGLFIGQPPVFTELLLNMALQADAASRNQ